ncbi:MAG: hypothetical protein JOZ17_26700 [Acetobacteraceae bacterium]|nr:hypothetical protein [Acetobacteraceae bacterium]
MRRKPAEQPVPKPFVTIVQVGSPVGLRGGDASLGCASGSVTLAST